MFKWSEKKCHTELNEAIIFTTVYAALFLRVLLRDIVEKYV